MADAQGLIRSPALPIRHAFLDARQSQAGDFVDAVGDALPVFVKQVHSALVAHVTSPIAEADRPEADAMVSNTPGLALAIVTADCAPVLLADSEAGVVGAAHAGWRGAVSGVLENTVAQMVAVGASPRNIVAAIGPCIAAASYEVDESMREAFGAEDARFFTAGRPGHYQFDLEAFAASRLAQAGVGRIDALGIDTYARADDFNSYRRATHRGEPTGGRQISLIAVA